MTTSKRIIVAAVAKNGVIGRTTKPCENRAHDLNQYDGQPRDRLLPCASCGGTERGIVPANDMPWHYTEDLAFFKAQTMGKVLAMGKNTWESVPRKFKPLAGRLNVVVSTTIAPDFWREFTSREIEIIRRTRTLDDAYALGAAMGQDVCVIGGVGMYREAIRTADTLILTLINRDYEGDVLFPGGGRIWHHADDVVFREGSRFVCESREQGKDVDLLFTRWSRR